MMTADKIKELIGTLSGVILVDDFTIDEAGLLKGRIAVATGQDNTDLEWNVEISPTYPFKVMGSEPIYFQNKNLLDYPHIMQGGNLCMHPAEYENAESQFVNDLKQLKECREQYNGVVTPFFRYSHRHGTANHPEYRLERMAEWSDQQSWELESLGRLPQTEWQTLCIDEANSYYSTEKEHKAEAGVNLSHKILFEGGTSLQIETNETFYYQRRTLDYDREGRRYSPQRDGFFFRPGLTLRWKHENREGRTWVPEWDAIYQGKPAMPALAQLLPIRDSSDPLNRFVGNADLGNPFTHELNTTYRLQHVKSGRSFNLNAIYRRLHNDIATQSVFDPATGIRTYQPVNTSRTHALRGRAELVPR